jgi:hypothetical protein
MDIPLKIGSNAKNEIIISIYKGALVSKKPAIISLSSTNNKYSSIIILLKNTPSLL